MVSKTTSLIFLILANIVLLAHVLLPHHHHSEEICFISSHCQNDNHSKNQSSCENSHQHDSDGKTTNCVLKTLVVLPSNQGKDAIRHMEWLRINLNHFLCISFISEIKKLNLVFTNCLFIPHKVFYNSSFLNSVLALRAPPTV